MSKVIILSVIPFPESDKSNKAWDQHINRMIDRFSNNHRIPTGHVLKLGADRWQVTVYRAPGPVAGTLIEVTSSKVKLSEVLKQLPHCLMLVERDYASTVMAAIIKAGHSVEFHLLKKAN